MYISLIVAKGVQNQIGYQNKLPWHLADDLARFHQLTSKHHVVMGRKTFVSIGHVLSNRINLIVSRQRSDIIPMTYFFSKINSAIAFAQQQQETELFVIGGAEIYQYFLQHNLIDKMYLTAVDYNGQADVFFPELDWSQWVLLEQQKYSADQHNEYASIFQIWQHQ